MELGDKEECKWEELRRRGERKEVKGNIWMRARKDTVWKETYVSGREKSCDVKGPWKGGARQMVVRRGRGWKEEIRIERREEASR